MVHGHQQHMVVIGHAHQTPAHQRSIDKVEVLAGLLCSDGEQLFFGIGLPGQYLQLQSETCFRGRDTLLRRLSLLFYKGRAQRLMAGHDTVQCALQRRLIKAAAQTQSHRNMVSGAATFQLRKKPQALLGKRQR